VKAEQIIDGDVDDINVPCEGVDQTQVLLFIVGCDIAVLTTSSFYPMSIGYTIVTSIINCIIY
jgi:hypothetical protein